MSAELTLDQRLDAIRARASSLAIRTPEAAQAVLEARARVLAQPTVVDDDGAMDVVELLLVQVGTEQLAIPVDAVVAIARAGQIAPLPRAVPPVYGVTAWRGRPLTVLTLGANVAAPTSDTRLVVLGTGARAALAIVVDAVNDLGRAVRAELTAAGPGPRHAYVLGVTPDGLLVLNGDALLHRESPT